eukprot:252080_1
MQAFPASGDKMSAMNSSSSTIYKHWKYEKKKRKSCEKQIKKMKKTIKLLESTIEEKDNIINEKDRIIKDWLEVSEITDKYKDDVNTSKVVNIITINTPDDEMSGLRERVDQLNAQLMHQGMKHQRQISEISSNMFKKMLKLEQEMSETTRNLKNKLKEFLKERMFILKSFGKPLEKIIPWELRNKSIIKYRTLFDGYYRELYNREGVSVIYNELYDGKIVPTNITRLISFYFPIFYKLKKIKLLDD